MCECLCACAHGMCMPLVNTFVLYYLRLVDETENDCFTSVIGFDSIADGV